jgi:hypothetical protein
MKFSRTINIYNLLYILYIILIVNYFLNAYASKYIQHYRLFRNSWKSLTELLVSKKHTLGNRVRDEEELEEEEEEENEYCVSKILMPAGIKRRIFRRVSCLHGADIFLKRSPGVEPIGNKNIHLYLQLKYL